MRSTFFPRLINPPFEDPGIFVPFGHQKRAFLFDLGDVSRLSSRDILKISHIFISHTHIDHFIGFDRVLRICLGRSKHLRVYGPPGILANLAGKLSAYTWNLLNTHPAVLTFTVHEIHPHHMLRFELTSRQQFRQRPLPSQHLASSRIVAESGLSVLAEPLDHQIPSMAFRLEERFHVNILKTALMELGLAAGPWIREFKSAVFARKPPQTPFSIPSADHPGKTRVFQLEELVSRIAFISEGQKIAYVTDAAYTAENRSKILSLAHQADHLFIEAGFLEEDRGIAREKHHLTAAQAGGLAGKARVKRLSIFHFSPRYLDRPHALYEEAWAAYHAEVKQHEA